MILKYDLFSNNKKVLKFYNKIKKIVTPYYFNKLNIYILPYYNLYDTIYKNSDLHINEYKTTLLIVTSFSIVMDDDKENIKILKDELRKENVFNMLISSVKVLRNTLRIISIVRHSVISKEMLFYNTDILNVLYGYINNFKMDIYNYNSIFENGEYLDIVEYINETLR